jgi:hypothetical protein
MCECGHYWTIHNEWTLCCNVLPCLCRQWKAVP